MSEVAVADGVCRLVQPDARWLATGVNGGYCRADRAVNVTVPTDFSREDLATYVAERCAAAGVDGQGPALLTAVEQANARGARSGSVTVVATAGLSNPATLSVADAGPGGERPDGDDRPPTGTVNILLATTRGLDEAGLARCLAAAVEAKTATLQTLTGFTGTTSDAVAVGSDPDGERVAFVGSTTEIGKDVRACVRDAISAGLAATYPDGDCPMAVEDAEHGAVTRRAATVFDP